MGGFETKVCRNCGEDYATEISDSEEFEEFCSLSCESEYYADEEEFEPEEEEE